VSNEDFIHNPVQIEQGIRKTPKIGGQLDASDLAGLILLLAFVPTLGMQIFDANVFVLLIPGVLFIAYIGLFKINKPSGYLMHFLKYHNRSRIWSPAPYQPSEFFDDARGEGSLQIATGPRKETR
jgi:hypothetical protein